MCIYVYTYIFPNVRGKNRQKVLEDDISNVFYPRNISLTHSFSQFYPECWVGITRFMEKKKLATCAMVKKRYIGDGHPTFNRNPDNGYINP